MTKKRLFRIGLTGGIASGKSTVSAMLREMGATVIDTDLIAHEITAPGSPALTEMSRRYGKDILNEDGSLRRDTVGKIVFSNPLEKEWLETLLHPLIWAEAESQAQAAFEAGQRVAVIDVPLLFESGWNEQVDEIWTVYVPQATQELRLQRRDGFTESEIRDRIASQWPIDEKAKRSDVIIDNTGPLEDTRRQVERAWNSVVNRLLE
jgi:dephospho-CoA kinase